ncbi:MAG: hypothetical protein L0216_21720 [Planctomycetales bacterium]|nr:hypothetical protein [Planctomycetales bacterium]
MGHRKRRLSPLQCAILWFLNHGGQEPLHSVPINLRCGGLLSCAPPWVPRGFPDREPGRFLEEIDEAILALESYGLVSIEWGRRVPPGSDSYPRLTAAERRSVLPLASVLRYDPAAGCYKRRDGGPWNQEVELILTEDGQRALSE